MDIAQRELARYLARRAADTNRLMVAIAGPPGAGKSTLAEQLSQDMNNHGISSQVVAMDGFHLDNSVLEARGLISRKGAPETFDARGFVELVTTLAAAAHTVRIPTFDRARDCVLSASDEVTADTAVLLVEGNYLLLRDAPWCELHGLFDVSIFLNPGLETLERRLVKRWLDHGLSANAARTRANSNDIPNAHYVLANSAYPDTVIQNH